MNPVDHWGVYNLQTIRVYAETPRVNSRQRVQRTPVNRCETHSHRGRIRSSQRINTNRANRQNDQRTPHPILQPIPLVISPAVYVSTFYVFYSNESPSNIQATQEQFNRLGIKKIEENDKFDDCSICLSNYDVGQEYIRLHCGHTYHKECIEQWLKYNPTCPQDRISVYL